jgi:hypothetical protein
VAELVAHPSTDPKVRGSKHRVLNICRQTSKQDYIVTVQRVAINNHGKSLRHGSACCNSSNWGQGAGKRHGPEES